MHALLLLSNVKSDIQEFVKDWCKSAYTLEEMKLITGMTMVGDFSEYSSLPREDLKINIVDMVTKKRIISKERYS